MRTYSKFTPYLVMMTLIMAFPLFAFMSSKIGLGEQRILVIMLKFPDVESSFSKEKMRAKYFVKLDRYLKAVSGQKTWIKGKMTDWYVLPHEVDFYRLSMHNLEVEKAKVTQLIQDAINLADKDEDFSQYSMIFLSLGAKRKDYGMMGLCGYPGMLGWQSQFQLKTKIRGQKIPNGVAIFCENAHVGVVFHDMAHIMGGVQNGRRVLPCLYDHDLQAQKGPFRNHYKFYLVNVGFYDPMSCHFYDFKKAPPGVCAWTKMRLNWIESRRIAEVKNGESKTVLLEPLGSRTSAIQVIKLPVDATTYYLIENRQPIGPDENLPSHGILVYYCDDKVAECRSGKSPIKLIDADPSVPQLKAAPFAYQKKRLFKDEKRNISIRIVNKEKNSYKIYVSNND